MKGEIAKLNERIDSLTAEVASRKEELDETQDSMNDTKQCDCKCDVDNTTKDSEMTGEGGNYTCGGTSGWRRVVYLDMTDPNTSCPSGWQPTGYFKRTVAELTLARFRVTLPFSLSGEGHTVRCVEGSGPISGGCQSLTGGSIRFSNNQSQSMTLTLVVWP